MKKIISLVFALAVAYAAMAQTSLRGRVVDQSTQTPVVGAKVTLANQNIATMTNASGEFSLLYLNATDEEVIIEADGYIAAIELIQLQQNVTNEMKTVELQQNIVSQAQDEILLNLTEEEMSDDEGRSQAQASSSSASTDVFNSTVSFAWSTARYRNRGYESKAESYYIEGLNFNSQERGQFNYSAMGGLNDASRYKDVINPIEANAFTFGGLGQATNYMMGASRYAQGWKVGVAGTNRNYKARVNATYASGVMPSGWAVIAQLAYRFSPYIDNKGIIGEGIKYYSLGYFLAAEKIWDNSRLKLITFGAPTERGQNAAVTQEVYDLTGSIYYNPYWGYQNGKVRNSRIVKSFDPTVVAAYEINLDEQQKLKVAAGYHYSWYSNSALNFYNAPDPRPDYYRNLPSAMWDGQIANPYYETSGTQLFDDAGKHYPWGMFIGEDMNGRSLGSGFVADDGNLVGPSVNRDQYNALVNLWKNRDNKTTQIDWENIYASNFANNVNNPDGSARYILERRHNDIQEASASVNYVNTQFNHLKMTVGLEGKFSQGIHYKTIDDLLGANQWIDVDAFADRDIKELASNSGFTQEDIQLVRMNEVRTGYSDIIHADGRRFGYDYRINMGNAKVWFQNEWSFNEVDLYYALAFNYTSMQRYTNMLNGRAWYLTKVAEEKTGSEAWKYYGKASYDAVKAAEADGTLKSGSRIMGDAHHFLDPAFKLGATYKINGRNRLKLNALVKTEAPLARDAYISQRVHDRVVENIYTHDKAKSLGDFYAASQKVASADLTYEFNYPIVRGRVTGFFTQTWNGTELNGYYDDEARTFVNQAMTGIDKRYMGIEAAAAVKMGTYFTLTGAASVGDYRYTSDANSVTSAENGMPMTQDLSTKELIFETRDKVLLKGLKLSTGPQVNASLKLSFFHPKMWFADITVNYHDWNYLSVAPSRRMQGLYTGIRTDGTAVNGWYGDTYANAVQTTDNQELRVSVDDNGNAVYENAVLDANGVPVLKYPYNIMTMQESLAATNPLNRFIIDASVGKLIYLKNRQSLSINLSVTNLTNNTHFKTGGYQQARLPRAVRQGEKDYQNSAITANAWKYPSKYYYAWGANFFLTVTYKF
ncbi:MAG: carboxypeptidase-like regulatory domain-containing protein [Paludibacteraceae bacterium]|nr:carboxypeptidase-like regulatory domain-containing protein [Paludibacteraceae bacterium]